MIPDESPWLRGEGISSPSSSHHYQYVPQTEPSSSSRHPISRPVTPAHPSKPSKKIKSLDQVHSQRDPLPDGCVDLFVAESESSEDDDDDGSEGNVWRKMKGRLKSDIHDLTENGRHLH